MNLPTRRSARTAEALRRALGRPTVWAPRIEPPMSPWVQRALANRLPAKDLTREITR